MLIRAIPSPTRVLFGWCKFWAAWFWGWLEYDYTVTSKTPNTKIDIDVFITRFHWKIHQTQGIVTNFVNSSYSDRCVQLIHDDVMTCKGFPHHVLVHYQRNLLVITSPQCRVLMYSVFSVKNTAIVITRFALLIDNNFTYKFCNINVFPGDTYKTIFASPCHIMILKFYITRGVLIYACVWYMVWCGNFDNSWNIRGWGWR